LSIDRSLSIRDEELDKLGRTPTLEQAAGVLDLLIESEDFLPFLTLPAYALLARTRHTAEIGIRKWEIARSTQLAGIGNRPGKQTISYFPFPIFAFLRLKTVHEQRRWSSSRARNWQWLAGATARSPRAALVSAARSHPRALLADSVPVGGA